MDDDGFVTDLEELPDDDLDMVSVQEGEDDFDVQDFVNDLNEPPGDPTQETPIPQFAGPPPSGAPMGFPGQPPMPPPIPSEQATMKLDKSAFNWNDPPEDDADGTMIISNPKITVMVDGKPGQVYALGMGTTSLGRSPDNDIHVPEERVSRKHAQIAFGPGGYAIYDLNSENGTYVNGNRIREHFLVDGDMLLIGTTQFLYSEK